jgi:signal peptidase II
MILSRKAIAIATVVTILLLDQVSKIAVKLSMLEHTGISVFGNWFQIFFIENEGMAFGITLGGTLGKLLLTSFRLIFSSFIIVFIHRLIVENKSKSLIFCTSLILAGALGNIIDSVFYGVIFSDSIGQVATFLPAKGYGNWFHGRVVDMLYFPIYSGHFPDWVPFVGGDEFEFFRFIFNVADAAISCGIAFLLLFQRSVFTENGSSVSVPIDAIEIN